MSKLAQQVHASEGANQQDISSERTLIIGDLARWQAQGRLVLPFGNVSFATFTDLEEDLLREVAPEFIFSPLFTADFDVIEVAAKLQRLGFSGRYRAVSAGIPNVEIVRADVRSHAPDLDFDLLVLPIIANDS